MRSSGQTDSQPKRQSKVLIIICTQNAESTITSILDRLPQPVRRSEQHDYHLLIIDNASADATVSRAYAYRAEKQLHKLSVMRHSIRQGDGENQKIAFSYAIENDFDVVALLGKDEQCAPETLMELIDPITTGRAAAVFGSRMLKTSAITRGTMPLYRRVANYGLNSFRE